MSRFATRPLLPLVVIGEPEGKRHHPELSWADRGEVTLVTKDITLRVKARVRRCTPPSTAQEVTPSG
ncbi:MAG: hypothetical protein ACRDQ7_13180, partial [Haloechinothrix sp.]